MSRPTISIIIPVYNAENYLRVALDSILTQTFSDWECILVNDGSKDSSGCICDEYAKGDNRFHVFHKENGGVSSARNIGIKEATGDWFYFCDADDYLSDTTLETFIDLMSENVDMIMAGYNIKNEDGTEITNCKKQISKVLNRDQALIEMYAPADYSYQGYLWCKLMKQSIIRRYDIKFDTDIFFNEDRLFIVDYLSHVEGHIKYTTTSVYNYIYRQSGAIGSLQKSYNRKYATDFDAYVKMKMIIDRCSNNRSLKKYAVDGIVSSYVNNHSSMAQFQDYDSGIHHHMIKYMFRTGAYKNYIKVHVLWPLLLLICPRLIIKR